MLKWNEEINWPILLAGTPLLYILRVNRSQMSFENKVIRLHLFSSSYHAELCFSYCNSSYFVLTIMRTIRYDCCWKNYKYFHKAYVYSTESETTSDIPKTIWIHHHRHRHRHRRRPKIHTIKYNNIWVTCHVVQSITLQVKYKFWLTTLS